MAPLLYRRIDSTTLGLGMEDVPRSQIIALYDTTQAISNNWLHDVPSYCLMDMLNQLSDMKTTNILIKLLGMCMVYFFPRKAQQKKIAIEELETRCNLQLLQTSI